MAIDICLEAYYGVGHTIDALWFGQVRHALGLGRRANIEVAPSTSPNEGSLCARSAAALLPFEQARAVWLVDVCGCDYAEASTHIGTTKDQVATYVADGRVEIRRLMGL